MISAIPIWNFEVLSRRSSQYESQRTPSRKRTNDKGKNNRLNKDESPIKKWWFSSLPCCIVYWRVQLIQLHISSYFIHFLYSGSIFIPSKLLQKVVAGSGTTGTTTVGVTTTTTTVATSITTTASLSEWRRLLWYLKSCGWTHGWSTYPPLTYPPQK